MAEKLSDKFAAATSASAASFNRGDYRARAENDYMLSVETGADVSYNVDFLARIMMIYTCRGQYHTSVLPFSQLEPAAIAAFRDELKRQGGHPPEVNELDKTAIRPAELKL